MTFLDTYRAARDRTEAEGTFTSTLDVTGRFGRDPISVRGVGADDRGAEWQSLDVELDAMGRQGHFDIRQSGNQVFVRAPEGNDRWYQSQNRYNNFSIEDFTYDAGVTQVSTSDGRMQRHTASFAASRETMPWLSNLDPRIVLPESVNGSVTLLIDQEGRLCIIGLSTEFDVEIGPAPDAVYAPINPPTHAVRIVANYGCKDFGVSVPDLRPDVESAFEVDDAMTWAHRSIQAREALLPLVLAVAEERALLENPGLTEIAVGLERIADQSRHPQFRRMSLVVNALVQEQQGPLSPDDIRNLMIDLADIDHSEGRRSPSIKRLQLTKVLDPLAQADTDSLPQHAFGRALLADADTSAYVPLAPGFEAALDAAGADVARGFSTPS